VNSACDTHSEDPSIAKQVRKVICLLFVCQAVSGCSDKEEPISVSAADLAVTNEILAKEPQVRLDREDFSIPYRAGALLHISVGSHYRGCYVTCSSDSLRIMGNLSHWLRGREKSEAVLRQFCQDPHFTFEGNRWTVVFRVLRSDGGVDEWTAIGEHDPQARISKIEKVEGRQLRPKGTFFYPLAG
jgi:hypothetical protein